MRAAMHLSEAKLFQGPSGSRCTQVVCLYGARLGPGHTSTHGRHAYTGAVGGASAAKAQLCTFSTLASLVTNTFNFGLLAHPEAWPPVLFALASLDDTLME